MPEISFMGAHKKFGISKNALWHAIRRGRIHAKVIQVSEVRLDQKEIAAYVAAIPEWRRAMGRKGGLRSAEARRRRLTAAGNRRNAAAG